MARTKRLGSANTLALRTRDPSGQKGSPPKSANKLVTTQADRCPFPGCTNTSSHQHSKSEGQILPSVDEYRKAGEAIRNQWSEEQRRRISENEALLRQHADIKPKTGGDLSTKRHLPRGNDLTVQEQINIIHGGATPEQYAAFREMMLEQQRQDIIDNTSPISPVFETDFGAPQTEDFFHSQVEHETSLEWNDFPELDAKYGNPPTSEDSRNLDPRLNSLPSASTSFPYNGNASRKSKPRITPTPHLPSQKMDFLNTNSLSCTGPCPVQTPHNQGAYLQQGQVPRTWNAQWGYSDPPREVWEAWVRIEQGCGRSWDRVQVDGFALSHWWAGPSERE